MDGNPRRPDWQPADDDTLIELHGQGLSCNAIAREMGSNPSTIWLHAKGLGLYFDRTRTAAANEARRQDAAAKRLQLELDLLDDAEYLRLQLYELRTYFAHGGKDFDLREYDSLPIPADLRNLMQSISSAAMASVRLAAADTGAGVENVRSMFERMGDALGVQTYLPAEDPEPDDVDE